MLTLRREPADLRLERRTVPRALFRLLDVDALALLQRGAHERVCGAVGVG